MGILISPVSGTELASLTIEKCSVGALNGTFAVTGSFSILPLGATLSTSDPFITEANTLKLAGQKAGIEGALTLTNGASGTGVTFTTSPYFE